MENKKKRVVAKDIENKKGKTFNDYCDEFEYLISAGIALNVQAISNPAFPLIESTSKNLLKLYMNDVGILTGILYGNNLRAILDDQKSTVSAMMREKPSMALSGVRISWLIFAKKSDFILDAFSASWAFFSYSFSLARASSSCLLAACSFRLASASFWSSNSFSSCCIECIVKEYYFAKIVIIF